MADNFDFPGQDEPRVPSPGDAGEADLPADFFEDVADKPQNHGHRHVIDHDHAHAHVEEPVHPAAKEFATSSEPLQEAVYRPSPPPPPEPDADKSFFPTAMSGVLLAALVGGVFYSRKGEETPAPAASPAPAPAAAVGDPPAPTPAEAPKPSPAVGEFSDRFKKVESEFDGLSKQIKDLQAKIDALPKPDLSAADLKTIEGKLEELAKSVAVVVPIPEKLGKLDERVGGIDGGLKSLRDDLTGLKDEVKKVGETAAKAPVAPAAAEAPKPAPADSIAGALSAGADAFKAQKYTEAAATFKKAIDAGSKDARLYYYAALASGLSTNDWNGDALKLVNEGIKQEKAGSPKADDINAAFAGLPTTLKPWLDAYRAQAR